MGANFNKNSRWFRLLLLYVFIILPWAIAALYFSKVEPGGLAYEMQNKECKHTASTYHAKLPELQREFKDVHEVTEACISCHSERGREIMQTAHWNWERESIMGDRGSKFFGKKNAINNYCIGTQSNEQTCTRCHIGYGWKDKSFDFWDEKNVDCLVCHDNTFTYKKASGKAGMVETGAKAPDLTYIAQNVCLPQKENCGKCHFWGGGGNNVKHGDLEKALLNCNRDVDVHMGTDGGKMICVDCHTAERHEMLGKSYGTSSDDTNRMYCEKCHTEKPHKTKMLNNHDQKIACQTCHIPTYAKANATKMYWDWSTAGRLDENGHEIHEEDSEGNHTYLSIKGSFEWEKNVEPEYVWFNGHADHYLLGDSITEVPVQINKLFGEFSCNESKIYPVKVHRGKQMYDPNTGMLIQVKTYGNKKGEGAFWKDFDMIEASKKGMEYVGLPFSGEVDYVETEMYMQLNHMVSPIEESLTCTECHSRDGRLSNLNDFYLPGRDRNKWIDLIGTLAILASLGGVIIHGGLRIIFCRKKKVKEIC